ncbi:hypothetical protein CC85DRAFT_288406 [Cutaneotrichosporon oleaginosum]|uniref:MFS general substrate transporter n=1 Tax=Cutaneotrichosporon oleaginosum TaxID=879819 RepID=A0A0J0XEX0_9TREE|nr:uncharacterized protein CC85DRAFT_288406 [Cutaneotrichosporon oleaginosum]KLT39611.1 hypothetical protein CC85DRAFT_288406 [Cutaneotrichosporon oleaginosum]TXT15462.1 hypothetical protein COLE_01655 [Cutaneotrichosporon oleaginosum]
MPVPRHDSLAARIERRDSRASEKLGSISVTVADGELAKLDEYEEVIAAETEFTEAEYKRLRRKFDFVLIPLLMIAYGLQYSDKTSLSSGVIFGLKEDTRLTTQQYNNLNSFFYMSYGVAQIPMGFLMQRFPLGRALSVSIIIWGAMVMLLGACNHYWDLSVVRVLLGWFESVVTPGFAVLTSSWYLRREQTLRQACYYAMNAFFSIVFGIAIYGIADSAQRNGGMAAWRIINLFLGGLTVAIGIIFLFVVGTPDEVWWLSKREKLMAKARIVENATGGGEQHAWKWAQVKECLRDPQYWFASIYNLLSCIPNGGLGAFNNLIYKSMGFTNLEVILYGMPNSAVACTLIITAATTVYYVPRARFPIAIVCQIVPCAVFLYVGLEDPAKKWNRWAAFTFYGVFAISTFMVWPLMSVNIAGRTKKTFMSASALIWYCIGNVVGTQIFVPSDAPKYLKGLISCGAVMCLNALNLGCWWWYYARTNARRDAEALASGISAETQALESRLAGELDLTDRENKHFRYAC